MTNTHQNEPKRTGILQLKIANGKTGKKGKGEQVPFFSSHIDLLLTHSVMKGSECPEE